MAKNELAPGQSRVGFAWDAKIREPYPAMLCDRDGRIELVIPFDSNIDELERRYVGDFVKWGDDPGLERFDYEIPNQFWFWDAHGFVCLVGVRRAGVNPLGGGIPSLSESTLRVAYAVFTGAPDVNYSTINGLTARIEGLDQWHGVRSVTTSLDEPSKNRSREMTVTIKRSTTTKVDALLNLTLVASAKWQLPGGVGKTSIEDTGSTRTLVKRPRAWNEHLDRHLAIHRLLEISAWRPLGFHHIRAMHSRDPLRVLSGDTIGDRWAPVHTYELPPAEGQLRSAVLPLHIQRHRRDGRSPLAPTTG